MTIKLKGKCSVCGTVQNLEILQAERVPAVVLAECKKCKVSQDFIVTEQLQEAKVDTEECPLGVENGHGSKAKK